MSSAPRISAWGWPGWALPAGLAGGIFLVIAGILRVPKKNKNSKEALATWTDLVVGAAVLLLAGYTLSQAISE